MSDKKMIDLEAAKKALLNVTTLQADGKSILVSLKRVIEILESLAVPVEKGAISIIKKDDGYWLQLNGTHTSAVIKIESKSEIVMRSISEISELISLHRPVDRDALATLLKKFGHGSWRSSAEWITIDTPIETILDAIMELIGRTVK